MKKWLMALLSVLLVAAMMVSFAACAGDNGKDDKDDSGDQTTAGDTTPTPAPAPTLEEQIVGTWELKIDFVDIFKKLAAVEGLDEIEGMEMLSGMKDMLDQLDDTKLEMTMAMTFNADKSGQMAIDKTSVKQFMGTVLDMTMGAAAQAAGMTLDQYYAVLEAQGMSRDDLIDQAVAEMDTSEMDMKFEYRLDGNKLYMSTEDDPDNEDYVEISIDGDNLSITGGSFESDDEDVANAEMVNEILKAILPIVLTKK